MAVYADNRVKLTYREYQHFPDDGKRHEIIDGEHHMSPAPSYNHQTVSRWIQYQLMRQIEEPGRGVVIDAPVDVELNEINIVQPDIVVVAQSRREVVSPARIVGLPDLIVEILSPSNPRQDTELKLRLYEQVGVPEYWIVDGEAKRLFRYRLAGAAYEPPTTHESSIEYERLEMKATVDLALVWKRT